MGYDEAETPAFSDRPGDWQELPHLAFHAGQLAASRAPNTLRQVMQREPPVRRFFFYHAAAYKHVPMMERHGCGGGKQTSWGIWHVAQAAINEEVEDFVVIISTDKAVRLDQHDRSTERVAERPTAAPCKERAAPSLRPCASAMCWEAMEA